MKQIEVSRGTFLPEAFMDHLTFLLRMHWDSTV